MIDVNPEFKIYDSILSLFGGVEIQPPFESSKLVREVEETLSYISGCLRKAYEVRSTTTTNRNLLTYTVYPTVAILDKKCSDDNINHMPTVARILKKLLLANRESAIMIHDNGFYLLHILKHQFDPKTIDDLIGAVETTIFELIGKKYNITSKIRSNVLEINTEIIPTVLPYII